MFLEFFDINHRLNTLQGATIIELIIPYGNTFIWLWARFIESDLGWRYAMSIVIL